MVSAVPKTRPPYPEEFRREAVQLVRSGHKIADVATSLGVTEQSLRNWDKQDQIEPSWLSDYSQPKSRGRHLTMDRPSTPAEDSRYGLLRQRGRDACCR